MAKKHPLDNPEYLDIIKKATETPKGITTETFVGKKPINKTNNLCDKKFLAELDQWKLAVNNQYQKLYKIKKMGLLEEGGSSGKWEYRQSSRFITNPEIILKFILEHQDFLNINEMSDQKEAMDLIIIATTQANLIKNTNLQYEITTLIKQSKQDTLRKIFYNFIIIQSNKTRFKKNLSKDEWAFSNLCLGYLVLKSEEFLL